MKTVEQVEVPGELLFTDDDSILFIDPAFETFRANRHLFLSKKAKFTFSGYAGCGA